MKFKPHTLVKGIVWEAIGVLLLFAYTWIITGELAIAGTIGFFYPTMRAMLWYPFERVWKKIRRRGRTPEKVEMTITVRDHVTRAINFAAKGIATCSTMPVATATRIIRDAFDRENEVIQRDCDLKKTPRSAVDHEALARHKLDQATSFSVSKELMYLARTDPVTAQHIRDELEIRIRTGGEPKERFQSTEFPKHILTRPGPPVHWPPSKKTKCDCTPREYPDK